MNIYVFSDLAKYPGYPPSVKIVTDGQKNGGRIAYSGSWMLVLRTIPFLFLHHQHPYHDHHIFSSANIFNFSFPRQHIKLQKNYPKCPKISIFLLMTAMQLSLINIAASESCLIFSQCCFRWHRSSDHNP